MKLWWTQSCAGNSPASRWRWSNDHDLQRSFPTNRSVSLWVRTWAAQERKIKTVVAEELHRGQVKGRKHSEFRAAGSHTAVADISDKHTGPKGKKKEKTPTQNTKSTNRMRYSIESYKGKLSYKVTPSPKLSYCSYFKLSPKPDCAKSFEEVSFKQRDSDVKPTAHEWRKCSKTQGLPQRFRERVPSTQHSTAHCRPHFSVTHIVKALR